MFIVKQKKKFNKDCKLLKFIVTTKRGGDV